MKTEDSVSIDTPVGTLVASTHDDGEYQDIYVDLKVGEREMQVCVVTVGPDGGLRIYPYNTTAAVRDDCDTELTVRTDGDRWYC